MTFIQITLLTCTLSIVFLLFWRVSRGPHVSQLSLPPGPKGLPIIGNLLDMRIPFEWLTYHRWCKELNSDIIHLTAAGTSIVVLDTYEVAMDLLEKRSSIYSSRPGFPMITELMGFDFSVTLMPYGDRWRDHRRLFHREFLSATAQRYRPHQRAAVHGLLSHLLSTPKDFMAHIEHMSGSLLISVAYGIRVQGRHDPFLEATKQASDTANIAAIPGAFLVDTFPILKHVPDWFPGARFNRKAKEWKIALRTTVKASFEEAKRQALSGTYLHSFTSYSMASIDPSAEDVEYQEQMIQNVAGSFYLGLQAFWLLSGLPDLNLPRFQLVLLTAVLTSFILAMVSHPDIQKKAQEEIDRVILPGHLPDFNDEDFLPYITAIVKEVLRWRPPAPIAVPHLLTSDDVYSGYRLPAKSVVLANVWSMSHDETSYPDPLSFQPGRFMKDGYFDETVRDPVTMVFGFGRRICPARLLGYSTVWICAASILASFNITRSDDGEGKIIGSSHQYRPGAVHMPLPFNCTITPRSEESINMIRSFVE